MTPEHFKLFLRSVADYLNEAGWYKEATYVLNCKTRKEVLDYLSSHCYSESASEDILQRCQFITAQSL